MARYSHGLTVKHGHVVEAMLTRKNKAGKRMFNMGIRCIYAHRMWRYREDREGSIAVRLGTAVKGGQQKRLAPAKGLFMSMIFGVTFPCCIVGSPDSPHRQLFHTFTHSFRIHWQVDFITCAEPRHARSVLIVSTVAIWYSVKVDARTVSVFMRRGSVHPIDWSRNSHE